MLAKQAASWEHERSELKEALEKLQVAAANRHTSVMAGEEEEESPPPAAAASDGVAGGGPR